MKATAIAHPNLAFVKYWGKRDEALRLPATGSISMTLGGLFVRTTVEFGAPADRISIDGRALAGEEHARTFRFLDRIRSRSGVAKPARIESVSNFPKSAGLASSAAGFAALALAGTRAAGLDLSPEDLALLARVGSGSATRSIHGGFVEWKAGVRPDGSDSHGVPIAGPAHWPDLRLVAAIATTAEKPCSSSEGMRRAREACPFYDAWIASSDADLRRTRDAIAARDFETLGRVAESNALRMHAVCLASEPPIVYWTPGTMELIRRIQALRTEGVAAWLSIDAGPNVFAICRAADETLVVAALEALPSVQRCLSSGPGPDARTTQEHLF